MKDLEIALDFQVAPKDGDLDEKNVEEEARDESDAPIDTKLPALAYNNILGNSVSAKRHPIDFLDPPMRFPAPA